METQGKAGRRRVCELREGGGSQGRGRESQGQTGSQARGCDPREGVALQMRGREAQGAGAPQEPSPRTVPAPFIELKGVRKSYGEGSALTPVLRGVDLSIGRGEVAVVLGASGSGKSTLLNVVGGLDRADEGSVTVDGTDLAALDARGLARYRRRALGFVFQSYNLVPDLTARENVEVCRHLAEEPLDIADLLDAVGLGALGNRYPGELSGGQQQRVSIARALAKNPRLLLCDEPTGALDSRTARGILELIEGVAARMGTTVVMVTHNEALAPMGDRVIRVRDGLVECETANARRAPVAELAW